MDSVDNSDLEALEKLRMERSGKNPFATKIDFDCWADNVKAVIACDPKARQQFNNYAAQVESMYAFKSDPLNAINGVIGVVNQVAMQWRLDLSKKTPENLVEVVEEPGQNVVANDHPEHKVLGLRVWLKKFWDTESTKIVSAILLAALFLFIKTYFGITLK